MASYKKNLAHAREHLDSDEEVGVQIEKLAALRERGALAAQEFASKKAEILPSDPCASPSS